MTVTINGTTGVTTPGVTNSGNETIAGTLQVGGVTTNVYPLVSGTSVASTSGTSIDFMSIPSWVKRITVMFSGVSTNGLSNIQLQIGSGSVLTSGYASSAVYTGTSSGGSNSTTGFIITSAASSGNTFSGANTICLLGSNTYVSTGNLIFDSASPAPFVLSSSGVKTSIGGTLDRVRITTVNGTDTFDAGSINILYE